jgi:glyceraldehyde-3-phosphate dehydrogenase (ferredoxin)
MISQKALYINANNNSFRVEDVKDENIIGPLDFGLSEVKKDKNAFTFGRGILAGSILPGSHRLIFCGHSPIWENFYISTMGGAALVFYKTGVNYVCINDKAAKPSVLRINRKDGVISCIFEEIDYESVWKYYQGLIGTYALQKFCFDKYKNEYKSMRILVTGPGAEKTKKGAIMSAQIVNGELTAIDCWAGRGGLGSQLFQEHNIVAIIYGGDYEEKIPALNDRAKIDKIFIDAFGKPMLAFDMEKGKKYRFDPDVNSGGTLGVNFTTSKENLFSFNYSSIYFTPEKRLEIHSKLIAPHYLKQFNDETIEKKQNKHCGEPCALVCKKMNNEFKKDYEPYEALGPNAGIFDQRAAEKLNHFVDAMGLDAIQAGSNVSWIMELISKGIISKEEYGLTIDPKFDPENFDVVNDSMRNAELGIQIVKMMLFNEKAECFRHGMRLAAEELDDEKEKNAINYAVFNAYGENGCMVPNQYWVPGMFSPMPIMGKYFEFYGSDILSPRELGKKNADRMIKEFYTDNMGICRFHRAWSETIIDKIVEELLGVKVNFYEHHKKLASEINENNNSVFWESDRVIDIVKIYLERMLSHNPDNPELKKWAEKFNKHKIDAAREYWDEILAGVEEVLG